MMTFKETKMKTILIALFATLSPCFAQEAKIMIVERSDSQKLAKAYREYKDALKRWEDVKIEVAKTYTQENGKAIAGWEKIQFSADFRALVPDSSQYASHLYACNGNGWITNTGSVPAASFSSGTLTEPPRAPPG